MNKSSIMKLIKNIHKGTPGTGMRDDVPASINGDTPAALSDGEFVIPADVVSMLGDGNTDAGAKILDAFLAEIRKTKGAHLAKGKQAPPLS
jgi:hypothetical protein